MGSSLGWESRSQEGKPRGQLGMGGASLVEAAPESWGNGLMQRICFHLG